MSFHTDDFDRGSWRFGHDASVLDALAEPEVDTVVLRRSLDPSLASALDDAAQGDLSQSSRVLDPSHPSLRDAVASLVANAPRALRDALVEDVSLCLRMLSSAAGARRTLATFASVVGDECTKFHQDFVRARLLVTYAGPGTVIVHRAAVDRHALDHPPASVAAANARIVRDSRGVKSVERGDVVVLKGGAWPGIAHGAVHRSPRVARTQDRRIVLALTQVADERSLDAKPTLTRTSDGHSVLVFSDISMVT
jgi:hypothetical protein